MAKHPLTLVKSTPARVEPVLTKALPPVETKGAADPWPEIFQLFGITSTATGLTISKDQALQMPAVQSAIRVLAESAASLRILAKAKGPDGKEKDLGTHPALDLLERPNPWTGRYDLIRDLVIDELTDDLGGMVWVNRVRGEALELIRYRTGVCHVSYDTETGEPSFTRGVHPVQPGDMIHARAPFGRSPLTLAREAIATGIVLANHAAQLFGNGARPSGALEFPPGMGQEAVKRARAAWRETHEGQDAGGKTAILYDGAKFTPFTFASTDAEFMANRKFQVLEVARCFRVPPSFLYDFDGGVKANVEQQGKEFQLYGLEPILQVVEGALTRALIPRADGVRLVFDRDDLTRADLVTRATAINALVAAQVINPNEGRDWLGMEARAGGDEFLNPNISVSPGGDPALTAKDVTPPAKDATDGL